MYLKRSFTIFKHDRFNTLRRYLTKINTYSTSNPSPGLFSVPGLHVPNDFLALAKESMSRCDDIRQSLKHHSKVTFSPSDEPESIVKSKVKTSIEVLHQLDTLSNQVCNVIDAAELCRCVHSSPEWRESASNAFHILSEYISDLNSDDGLYESLCQHVTSDAETFAQLTEEQQRMATLLKNEFERDGIHLPQHERQELRIILQHATNLESMFSNNITTRKKYFGLDRGEVLRIIPAHILEAAIPPHEAATIYGVNEIKVSSDAHITNTLLKYSSNPSLRKEAYMQSNTSCPENLEVLEALRERRHQIAQHLGFPSYAHKFLGDKMARHPKNVLSFLNQMNRKIKDGATTEMAMISKVKQMVEGDSTIYPWDIAFYTGLIKSQKYELDFSEISPYLSVENCIEGMKMLVQSLFGMRIEEAHMSKNENWVEEDNSHGPIKQVRKLIFYDGGTDEMIGTLYLDLHPRDNKYAHAAHFTVRCGCAVNTDPSPEFQLPIVALVCNLSTPNPNTSSTILSHSETETLFHEFGHALHSLLSRTTYQHLSGTRAAMDFVETPSHLIENYCWDPTFLTAIGKHYANGNAIPAPLIAKLVESRNSFQFIELQTQVIYALFDQELFGIPSSNGSIGKQSTIDIFARLHKENNIPYAEGTHWHTRFGHLVTYGAGYYGYLYDQVFAADIWETCLAENPLKQDKGEILWKEMLRHGGARDPNTMLRNVLGREPSLNAFFQGMKN